MEGLFGGDAALRLFVMLGVVVGGKVVPMLCPKSQISGLFETHKGDTAYASKKGEEIIS